MTEEETPRLSPNNRDSIQVSDRYDSIESESDSLSSEDEDNEKAFKEAQAKLMQNMATQFTSGITESGHKSVGNDKKSKSPLASKASKMQLMAMRKKSMTRKSKDLSENGVEISKLALRNQD